MPEPIILKTKNKSPPKEGDRREAAAGSGGCPKNKKHSNRSVTGSPSHNQLQTHKQKYAALGHRMLLLLSCTIVGGTLLRSQTMLLTSLYKPSLLSWEFPSMNLITAPTRRGTRPTALSDKQERLAQLITELEGNNNRYYFYDDPILAMPDVRQAALDPNSVSVQQQAWTKRFRSYARGEAQVLEALEHHPLRTTNFSEAAFAVIPIPFCSAFMFSDQRNVTTAFEQLLQNDTFYYQQHPERHLFFTPFEYFFRRDKMSFTRGFGYSKATWHLFQKSIVAKDYDVRAWGRYKSSPTGLMSDFTAKTQSTTPIHLFQQSWSVGYIQEANVPTSEEDVSRRVNVENWHDKHYNVFYHTRVRPSLNNSTIYRHAPVHVKGDYLPPSSVGFQLDPTEWLTNFQDSKFCLIIRGDNPTTRAFFRSISMGCVPIIISDPLPYYQPVFRSFLKHDDFAIVIPEADFLANPAGSVNQAITTLLTGPSDALELKLGYLAFVQRLLMIKHPSSLFVQAFIRETVASQTERYNEYPPPTSNTSSL